MKNKYMQKYYDKTKQEFVDRATKWKKENPEYVREYHKKYRKNNREKFNKYNRDFYKDNKKIVKARQKAARKIPITDKDKCEKCGSKNLLHRHHEDYSKPLEIIILCTYCHTKLHKTTKNEKC